MHLYTCEYLSATVPRCPQRGLGAAQEESSPLRVEPHGEHQCHIQALMSLARKVTAHRSVCSGDHSPNPLALELPRLLFSDSGRSCDTLQPLLGSGTCLDVLTPSCLGRAAPTAPLPEGMGGVLPLGKAVAGEALPVVLEILVSPIVPNTHEQIPSRAMKPCRGRKEC